VLPWEEGWKREEREKRGGRDGGCATNVSLTLKHYD